MFYRDTSLKQRDITWHVLQSDTEMPLQRLLNLVLTENRLHFKNFCEGHPDAEDTFQLLVKVYKDDSPMLKRSLLHKTIDPDLSRGKKRDTI